MVAGGSWRIGTPDEVMTGEVLSGLYDADIELNQVSFYFTTTTTNVQCTVRPQPNCISTDIQTCIPSAISRAIISPGQRRIQQERLCL